MKRKWRKKPVKIINELKGKEGCINGLLDKKGDSYVKDLLSNFKGDSEFDIKIESKEHVFYNDEEVSGITRYKRGSNFIQIEINSSSARNRPVIEVARTLLHEYIHADMYRKLNTANPDEGILDFRETYNKYKNENFKASAQHETMAQLYTMEMAKALKSFHKQVLSGDYNYMTNNGQNPLPFGFYEALAWRGLKNHNVDAYRVS